MDTPAVIFPDVEKLVIDYLRPLLEKWRPFLSNRLTSDRLPAVIVRDDGGKAGFVQADHRIGVRVITNDPQAGSHLARTIQAYLNLFATDTYTPVTQVATFGPYRVEADKPETTEYYLTAELTVIGKPFNI